MAFPMIQHFDCVLKLILIGDAGVGKTAAAKRYVNNVFARTIASTGIDFMVKLVQVGDKVAKLQLWDTAGQERFRCITNHYFRGATGVMVFYDITRVESFRNVACWLECIKNSCAPDDVKVMMVGNKCDLGHRRTVDRKRAEDLARENGMLYFEISSKDAVNVDECFDAMTKEMLQLVSQGHRDYCTAERRADVDDESRNKTCCSRSQ